MMSSVGELRTLAINNVDGDYLALILFGSRVRGDATPASDVDVLQVVAHPRPSYRKDQICYSVYTPRHLHDMAYSGNLFVLHLVNEAVEIDDKIGVLSQVRQKFNEPSSYDGLRDDVRLASRLLDVDIFTYEQYWRGLHVLTVHLLRTFLYSLIRDQGRPTFSMRDVLAHFDDPTISAVLSIRDMASSDIQLYRHAIGVVEGYTGTKALNPFGSIQALVLNEWSRSPYTFIHGLRLLNGPGRIICYDE